MLYTVREASEKLGIPSSTIRFYDKKGLLPFIERSPNGVRVFTESDIAHLQDLLTLKEAGFSIKEISEYAKLETEGTQSRLTRSEILKRRCVEMESEITRLQDILEMLREQYQRCTAALEKQSDL